MIEEKYRGIEGNITSDNFIQRKLAKIKHGIDHIKGLQERIREYDNEVTESLLMGDVERSKHYIGYMIEYRKDLEKAKNMLEERLKVWEQEDKVKVPIFYLRKSHWEIEDDLNLLHRAKEFYEDEIKLKEQSEMDTEHYTLVVRYLERLTEELKKFSKVKKFIF